MYNFYLVKYYENIVVLVRPQWQIHHFKLVGSSVGQF